MINLLAGVHVSQQLHCTWIDIQGRRQIVQSSVTIDILCADINAGIDQHAQGIQLGFLLGGRQWGSRTGANRIEMKLRPWLQVQGTGSGIR